MLARSAIFACCAVTVLGVSLVVTPAEARSKAVNYKTQIKPIFERKCISCHKKDNASGGLDMTTKASLNKGGVSGKAVKVGKGSQSLLVKRLKGQSGALMPYGGPALKATEISLISRWINEGAKM